MRAATTRNRSAKTGGRPIRSPEMYAEWNLDAGMLSVSGDLL